MSHIIDEHLEERLEVLRRFNPDGYGTSDTSALDPDGAVEVTIDPTDRVREVRVLRPELVSTPESLAAVLALAYRNATAARRDSLRGAPTGVAPTPRRAPLPIAQVENWADAGWRPDPATVHLHDYQERDLEPVRGISDNDCVSVVLEPAISYGPVDADPGWLANATATQIGAAVTQAFAAAYRERDK